MFTLSFERRSLKIHIENGRVLSSLFTVITMSEMCREFALVLQLFVTSTDESVLPIRELCTNDQL